VQREKFDSFGERLNYDERGQSTPSKPVAGWLARAGTGIFWSLVFVILVARAVCFDPDFARKFGQVAALSRAIRTILGA
jgi:hypothetical protein